MKTYAFYLKFTRHGHVPDCTSVNPPQGVVARGRKYFPEKVQSPYWGPIFCFKLLAETVHEKKIVAGWFGDTLYI